MLLRTGGFCLLLPFGHIPTSQNRPMFQRLFVGAFVNWQSQAGNRK
jgi:hypothetical protein